MTKYLFFMLFYSINIVYGYSQINEKSHIESGMFVCRANQYLIFVENDDIDSEGSTYTIKSININTDEKYVIDKQTTNKCVNLSDTVILYIKGTNIISYNLESKRKFVYYKADTDLNSIGFCYNKNTSNLLLVQINFKTYDLFLKILNDKKQIIFCQKIKVNDMELDGVVPILASLNDFFILSVQDHLYTINSKKLDFKMVSDKCDSYALNNDEKVIYYKFVTDEKTEGYSIDLITQENKKIDNVLNDKIYNCEKSFLFTANIDGNFIPTYVICNEPYLMENCKWQKISEVFVYKDNTLIIKMPSIKNVIDDNYFQWKLR